jgi:hypothetical protein
MLHRRIRFVVVVLALLVVAPAMAVSAGEPLLPLLWSGQVQNQVGQHQPEVEVVAFARPPVEALQVGIPLAEVARARTDREGNFSLRAGPSAAMTGNADPAGWTTVMVAAFSSDGMTLAVDSVAWEGSREFSAENGRWVTSPAERGGRTGRTMSAREATSLASTERPSVMVLHTPSPSASGVRPYRRPSEVRGCSLSRSKEVGRTNVPVGELHLENHWGGYFDYTNTRSTSFQIGFSKDGKPWKVAGSVSMDRSRSSGQGKLVPVGDGARLHTYALDMIFKDLTWLCGSEYQYYFAETREPTDWTGGVHEQMGGRSPECRNRRYAVEVIPMGYFRRAEDASVTFAHAIDVGGFQAGMTSVISSSVEHRYDNGENRHRNVCGEKDFPTVDTRIASMA